MAALKLSEGVGEKLDLILARLDTLDTKMEELNTTVKGIQRKMSLMEIDMDAVKNNQKKLVEYFSHIETNSTLVDKRINQLQSSLDKNKDEINECHKNILYLEAYSRRENLRSPTTSRNELLHWFLEQ